MKRTKRVNKKVFAFIKRRCKGRMRKTLIDRGERRRFQNKKCVRGLEAGDKGGGRE